MVGNLGAAPFLVFGVTGVQGGAVVAALLARDLVPTAYVRDPDSAASQALVRQGVRLAVGLMDDHEALVRAMHGVTGIFSMQPPPAPDDPELEVRMARAMVAAAKAAGVSNFVHTSVARADEHDSFSGWAEQRWWPTYWESKAAANNAVREAGFDHWTILKPAFMMENYIPPRAMGMYPGLAARGRIETALDPDTRLDLIAGSDIGQFGAAALVDPARFNRMEIPLAAESLTMDEVAQIIAQETGKEVSAVHVSGREAVALGNHPGLTESQRWASVEGYRVDLDHAASLGIPLTSFREFTQVNRSRFVIGCGEVPSHV